MAEDLTTTDVQNYTNGRLSATDPSVQTWLDTALARCRRFCDWHVSPVQSATVTVKGSGEYWLPLHTLSIDAISSITEVQYQYDGGSPTYVTVDPTTLQLYSNEPSVIYRRGEHFHRHYDYQVAFSHGFAAIDAMDFRMAVLQYIDLMTQTVGTPGSGPLSEYQVDDVTAQWATDREAGAIANNPVIASALYQYRILPFA